SFTTDKGDRKNLIIFHLLPLSKGSTNNSLYRKLVSTIDDRPQNSPGSSFPDNKSKPPSVTDDAILLIPAACNFSNYKLIPWKNLPD
ncbi:hypothetical protein, partial [Desulfolithobacter sp.]